MVIEITFVGEFSFILDDPDSCNNAGLACLTCPHYDACDHHYEEDEL